MGRHRLPSSTSPPRHRLPHFVALAALVILVGFAASPPRLTAPAAVVITYAAGETRLGLREAGRTTALLRVPHPPGFPVRAIAAPSGLAVALVVPESEEPAVAASVWLADLASGELRLALRDVEATSPVRFGPAGDRVMAIARRPSADLPYELRAGPVAHPRGEVVAISAAPAVDPIGWDGSGAGWWLEVGPQGSIVASTARSVPVAGLVRDPIWVDSVRLLVTRFEAGRYELVILDLGGGDARPWRGSTAYPRVAAGPPGSSGAVTLGFAAPGASVVTVDVSSGAEAAIPVVAGPSRFDVPLAWNADATWLAILRSAGAGPDTIVDQEVVLVGPGGASERLEPATAFLAWLPPGTRPRPLTWPAGIASHIAASDAACAQTNVQAYQPHTAEVAGAATSAAHGTLGATYPALPALKRGASTTPQQYVAGSIPDVVVKAIAYAESGWRQAAAGVARGSAGAPLLSGFPGSCGYGVMQITSGMGAPGSLPVDTQRRIASDYRFNIAWGARTLIEKWNAADAEYDRNVNFKYIGDRNPCLVEDWYYAVWAYNRADYHNNPANPIYDPLRTPYNPNQSSRYTYPYQEKVFGMMRNPPIVGGSGLWAAVNAGEPPRSAFSSDPAIRWPNLPTPGNPNLGSNCGGGPTATATPAPTATATPVPFTVFPQQIRVLMAPTGSRDASIAITSAPPGTTWSVTSTLSWVQLSTASGTGTALVGVTFLPQREHVGNGTYTGTLSVHPVGYAPVTIPVTAIVAEPVFDRRLTTVFVRRGGGW